ncbi:uncharacterized protein [Drosophila virilis]|uniref:MARVEL domain-containing protein n=1 Tax=Drosophila virilis TaxID=7244 RepID=A0A0Q9WBX8_DROVI|nr:uncharacterized protein LOC26531336 [Drosophila virilis]KRF82153.1 uncharacterized protein Dvir_GJ26566 [Drosophila virilis]
MFVNAPARRVYCTSSCVCPFPCAFCSTIVRRQASHACFEPSSQIFTASIIILIEGVADHSYSSQAMLVCGTLTGYLIICSVLSIGHLVGAKLDKRIDILFTVAGCVLFVSTGAIILDRWMNCYEIASEKNTILASGVLAFATAAIFIADTFIIFHAQ